jgi:hypothetical protein
MRVSRYDGAQVEPDFGCDIAGWKGLKGGAAARK